MLRLFHFITLFFCGFIFAQEEVVQSVYFEFGKFDLNETQANATVDFIKNADSTRIESIQIFGYTDDIGKDDYNFKLSTNRANAIINVAPLVVAAAGQKGRGGGDEGSEQ